MVSSKELVMNKTEDNGTLISLMGLGTSNTVIALLLFNHGERQFRTVANLRIHTFTKLWRDVGLKVAEN